MYERKKFFKTIWDPTLCSRLCSAQMRDEEETPLIARGNDFPAKEGNLTAFLCLCAGMLRRCALCVLS